jgi:dTDP-4-dehydrorhamnose reductase
MATVLILGGTGKLGSAFARTLRAAGHSVTALGSRALDAADFEAVTALVRSAPFDAVINGVAFLGIDNCEHQQDRAFHLNLMLPRLLAGLSRQLGFTLIHVSTDSVFSGAKGGPPYVESDRPDPVNVYGLTKCGGDFAVLDGCERHYVVRVGVLFGPSPKPNQVFEKMMEAARAGQSLFRLSNDIVTSPSYSLDVAAEVAGWLERPRPYGLYHVVNQGQASIHDFIGRGFDLLGLRPRVEAVSYRDLGGIGRRNTLTPMASDHVSLRPWDLALQDYCRSMTDSSLDPPSGNA